MARLSIVAEVGANHLGSYDKAIGLIEAAADSGATHIKYQTYTIDDMIVNDQMLTDGPWKGRTLSSLYKEAALPMEWHGPLFKYARELGLVPFSTPFSVDAVDFLEDLDCPMYKIASFELTDTPLIRRVAQTNKPIIISTGMASEEEIETAVKEAKSYGPQDITLLKCTSAYPSTAEGANLNTMSAMYFRFRTHVGISDHSDGIGVACAAIGYGATVIEKHLTLSRADGGPDAEFSMEPSEFKQLVVECNRAYNAKGVIAYGHSPQESSSYGLRRSLYFAKRMKAGDYIKESDIRTARPFAKVSPQEVDKFYGQTIIKDVKRGEPVTWECINASNPSKQ